MASGNVEIKLRPLKIGFLVSPNDKTALRQAIEINSFLWGGTFNPIIPAYRGTPLSWKSKYEKPPSGKNIVEGYLDAYDPDYVLALGKAQESDWDIGPRSFIKDCDIFETVDIHREPLYGIGLFDILNHFYKEELKFVRRDPIEMCIFNYARKYNLFLASVFGVLPEKINNLIINQYEVDLGVKTHKCTIENYFNYFSGKRIFYRRISSLYINAFPGGIGGLSKAYVFFLDASNSLDVIDYWNLRAMGLRVLPVAKQSAGHNAFREYIREFVDSFTYYDVRNPQIFYVVSCIKSRSTSEKEVEQFIKSLNVDLNQEGHPKIVFQHWYPRIWHKWSRGHDGVAGCDLEVHEERYDLPENDVNLTLHTDDPKFAKRYGGHGHPRFANELHFNIYGHDKNIYAQVIPSCDNEMSNAFGRWYYHNLRFSNKGIVFLSEHVNWSIEIKLPKAEDVFYEWFKSKKLTVELSPAGLIAKQITKYLGGLYGTSILTCDGLIELLAELGEKEEKLSDGRIATRAAKIISKEDLWGRLSKMANQSKYPFKPDDFLKRLVDTNVFKLGVELQCPICLQRSWYSLDSLVYKIQCLKCLEYYKVPSHSPKDLNWSYRLTGPFALPYQAYGAFSVLLTLRFFSVALHGAVTPMFSFTTSGTPNYESDFALFFRQSQHYSHELETIFGECKTFNVFNRKDIQRMRLLAKQFPGAILVFATLNKKLTDKEKNLILPFVNQGRKYWEAERPYNPVLILTGIELLSTHGIPYCWEDVGGKYSEYAKAHRHWNNMIELCDQTQQLHLDMEPWHNWLKAQWEKKRKKKSPKT